MTTDVLPRPEDAFIAVLGLTGSGKTNFISKFSSAAELGIGHGLTSETQKVKVYPCSFEGRRVHFIDTPGFDDTYRSDAETFLELSYWLAASYSLDFRLTGILYLHAISHSKMGATAMQNLGLFQAICGPESMPSAVLVSTMWSQVPAEVGIAREKELLSSKDFWGELVSHGCQYRRFDNSLHTAASIIRPLLERNAKLVLRLQVEMKDEAKPLADTQAGVMLAGVMEKGSLRFEAEMQELEQELSHAIASEDQESAQMLNLEQNRMAERLTSTDAERKKLDIDGRRLIEEQQVLLRKQLEDQAAQRLQEEAAEQLQFILQEREALQEKLSEQVKERGQLLQEERYQQQFTQGRGSERAKRLQVYSPEGEGRSVMAGRLFPSAGTTAAATALACCIM